jgi:hypothetical protein
MTTTNSIIGHDYLIFRRSTDGNHLIGLQSQDIGPAISQLNHKISRRLGGSLLHFRRTASTLKEVFFRAILRPKQLDPQPGALSH